MIYEQTNLCGRNSSSAQCGTGAGEREMSTNHWRWDGGIHPDDEKIIRSGAVLAV